MNQTITHERKTTISLNLSDALDDGVNAVDEVIELDMEAQGWSMRVDQDTGETHYFDLDNTTYDLDKARLVGGELKLPLTYTVLETIEQPRGKCAHCGRW